MKKCKISKKQVNMSMNNLKYQTPNIASNMCVDLGGGGSVQTPWKIQFSLIYIVSLLPICLGHPSPGN